MNWYVYDGVTIVNKAATVVVQARTKIAAGKRLVRWSSALHGRVQLPNTLDIQPVAHYTTMTEAWARRGNITVVSADN